MNYCLCIIYITYIVPVKDIYISYIDIRYTNSIYKFSVFDMKWRIKNTIIPHREGSGGGAEDGGGGRDEQEEEEEDLLADWCWCAAPT